MLRPYMSLQNGKTERIIHSVNNVIRTLLIQASLLGHYWTEGLHAATYLLNHLPITVIQATCPHLALFGSTPSYEHLRVFGCTYYPNPTATAPHKLFSRSIRCVFLGYSTDHKGYCCLDFLTNRLIVSRHVVFDEDSFPLAISPSLTDLDFLCEYGPTVFTIGTHLTTTGISTSAPHRPAPEIPPGFVPPVAPLPAPTVPPGFLPQAATMAAPPAGTYGSPPRTWSASPVAYVRQELGARAVGTRGALGAALRREAGAGAQATRGAPGAALRREVGARAVGTRVAPRSYPVPGGGSLSHVDMWRLQSCSAPGGGCKSPGDTWCPRSCPEPGGEYHSTAPSSAPFRGWSGCGGACHAPR
jgi:hypothetical protein